MNHTCEVIEDRFSLTFHLHPTTFYYLVLKNPAGAGRHDNHDTSALTGW